MRSDKQDAQVDSSVLQLISDLTNKVDQEHAAILSENEPRPEGMADEPAEGLRLKVEHSIQKLQKGLLERETEVPWRPNKASHHTHMPCSVGCMSKPHSIHWTFVHQLADRALLPQVRLLLLAGLASEHLLLLGPPGTAKSELSRRLSNLTSGRYYERLLTRFSVPEELFGPLSMRGTPYVHTLCLQAPDSLASFRC